MNSKANPQDEEVFIIRAGAGLAMQKLEHTSNEIEMNSRQARE